MSGASRSISLVLGGQRSGKSEYAEALAPKLAASGIYLATTDAPDAKDDAEFRHRIQRHRERRDAFWRTIEEPLDLPAVLGVEAQAGRVVLVECLTLWLSNLLARDLDIEPEIARLLRALEAAQGHVILVSNEVGLGIVPANALARRFADVAGDLHQAIASNADRVVLVAAGLPLMLKGTAG